ncbi:hypothetical protein TNCV_4499441 [Trichonephila clavipes]|nr:hypothetical protein TNCV_4499441 [Trichonephila clavipes]
MGIKISRFNIEWEHRPGTQNTIANILSRNPIESIIGEKVNCAIIREISDDIRRSGICSSDIERLFEEARRNTETKQEKWKKYYNRRRRDVQVKVNDWVLVAAHP